MRAAVDSSPKLMRLLAVFAASLAVLPGCEARSGASGNGAAGLATIKRVTLKVSGQPLVARVLLTTDGRVGAWLRRIEGTTTGAGQADSQANGQANAPSGKPPDGSATGEASSPVKTGTPGEQAATTAVLYVWPKAGVQSLVSPAAGHADVLFLSPAGTVVASYAASTSPDDGKAPQNKAGAGGKTRATSPQSSQTERSPKAGPSSPPDATRNLSSQWKAQYALTLPAGSIAKRKLKNGSQVTIPPSQRDALTRQASTHLDLVLPIRGDQADKGTPRGDGRLFRLELALSEESRYQGLSDRASVAADGGMLFVFPDEYERSFVMRDCLTPIDIAFLDAEGVVVATHAMTVEPKGTRESELTPYWSRRPAQFAIELRGGLIRTMGIKVGDRINLPLNSLKRRAR